MTIKLILLKSGEDIIADLKEMTVGEGDDVKVIGYYLSKPCIVKMKNPTIAPGENHQKTAGYEVTLFPWMPLSNDDTIPIPADWLVTLVEPISSLRKMYTEDIVEHGQDNQSSGTSKSTDSDN